MLSLNYPKKIFTRQKLKSGKGSCFWPFPLSRRRCSAVYLTKL